MNFKTVLMITLIFNFILSNADDIDYQAPCEEKCKQNLREAGFEGIAECSGICNRFTGYESDGPWFNHRFEASCALYAKNKTDDDEATIHFFVRATGEEADKAIKMFEGIDFNDCMNTKKALLAAIYKDKPKALHQFKLEELDARTYALSLFFPSTNPNHKFVHEVIKFSSKKALEKDLTKAGFVTLIENTDFCENLAQSEIVTLGVINLVNRACNDFKIKTQGDYPYSELCVERKKDLIKVLFKNNPAAFEALRSEGLYK
jgi:hypothetical protein